MDDVPRLIDVRKNTLAEIIFKFAEAGIVAHLLEKDANVTISRSSRLLRELYEKVSVMTSKMHVETTSIYHALNSKRHNQSSANAFGYHDHENSSEKFPAVTSYAQKSKDRDEAWQFNLSRCTAKSMALKVARRFKARIEDLSVSVDSFIVASDRIDGSVWPKTIRAPRGVLLFHVFSVLDPYKGELECLE